MILRKMSARIGWQRTLITKRFYRIDNTLFLAVWITFVVYFWSEYTTSTSLKRQMVNHYNHKAFSWHFIYGQRWVHLLVIIYKNNLITLQSHLSLSHINISLHTYCSFILSFYLCLVVSFSLFTFTLLYFNIVANHLRFCHPSPLALYAAPQ